MVEEPDRVRRDIEATRASLTRDVDLLAEKTSPRQAARRRWTAVRERVMGSADQGRHAVGDAASTVQDKAQDAASSVQDKAHDAADAVRSAPQAVAAQTQGNPLAAGIIAFGVGMLAATLMPVTEAERRAGQELKERSGDLTEKVKDVATDFKDDLSGSARQAADQVRSTAQDAVQTTKEQAAEAKDRTVEATRNA
jgi:gas vesicle protein